MSVATTQRRHINVGIAYELLNERIRRVLDIIFAWLIIIVAVVVSIALVIWASFLNNIGAHYESTLASPLSVICYILATGMVLAVVGSVGVLLRR